MCGVSGPPGQCSTSERQTIENHNKRPSLPDYLLSCDYGSSELLNAVAVRLVSREQNNYKIYVYDYVDEFVN